MNREIETLFENFTVGGISIPVSFLYYEGHGEPYVTYMEESTSGSLTGDDELQGYVAYYDFDIYATGNFMAIIEAVKKTLVDAGWVWQVSRSSEDMYEPDTKYYHKTLNFAIEVMATEEEENNG